jgi:hypothetical protein
MNQRKKLKSSLKSYVAAGEEKRAVYDSANQRWREEIFQLL